MNAPACDVCGWANAPQSAVACVRCGAPIRRNSGLSGVAFAASTKDGLNIAFAKSRALPPMTDPHLASGGIGWTAFGSGVALLLQSGSAVSLERLDLSAQSPPSPVISRTSLMAGLDQSVMDSLVAPPIATRTGTALVTARELSFWATAQARTRFSLRQASAWSPPERNKTIRSAALSPVADLFVAVAADNDVVSVHNGLGAPIVTFEDIHAEPRRGVGLAISGVASELKIYAWSEGRIAWRHLVGGSVRDAGAAILPDLPTPPGTWRGRLTESAFSNIAWPGWREAAAGAFPVVTSGAGPVRFGALVLGEGTPKLIRYCEGRPRFCASGAREVLLYADEIGMKAVNPRTGLRLAERRVAVEPQTVCTALSSASFVSLSQRSAEFASLTAWTVRDNAINQAFELELRGGTESGRVPLQVVNELPPIELDDGIAIALNQGAAAASRLRLWCDREAFEIKGRAA